MDYSNERITDRRAIARIKMEAQVAADAIKGELCNYIRETTDPKTINAVNDLAITNPLVYKYIRRLESINNNIYCSNCERVKHVTGFNEGPSRNYNDELFEQQCQNVKRKIDNLAGMVKDLHDNYTTNKVQIEEYFKGIINELSECRDTVTNRPSPQKAAELPLKPAPKPAPKPQTSGTLDNIFKPLMQFDDDGMF